MVAIASQPFWLHWTDRERRRVSHASDYFARRADGSAVVIDCRPVERRKGADVAKFDATAGGVDDLVETSPGGELDTCVRPAGALVV